VDRKAIADGDLVFTVARDGDAATARQRWLEANEAPTMIALDASAANPAPIPRR
jgi:hypothetical protein